MTISILTASGFSIQSPDETTPQQRGALSIAISALGGEVARLTDIHDEQEVEA